MTKSLDRKENSAQSKNGLKSKLYASLFWLVGQSETHIRAPSGQYHLKTDEYIIFRNNHDYEILWKQINDIIIKTLIAAHPVISHSYRTCFPSHINHSGEFFYRFSNYGARDSFHSGAREWKKYITHFKLLGCFEILGFDILLDRKLKPWILEVNHSPSFHTDSDLDKEIKEGLLYDALNMLHVKASDRTQAITDDKKRTQQVRFCTVPVVPWTPR